MIPDSAAPAVAEDSRPAVAFSRRWGLGIFAAVLLAAFAGATVWFVMQPVFTTKAFLHVGLPQAGLLRQHPDDVQTVEAFLMFQRTQHQLIKSQYIVIPALRHEELTQLPAL